MNFRTTWALALSILLLAGILGNFALAHGHELPAPDPQLDKPAHDWTLVQDKDGLRFYLSTTANEDGRFLSVRIENTRDESTSFIWSITRNNEPVRITEDEMTEAYVQLEAHATQIIDGNYLIYLAEDDLISDFVIHIKTAKH